MLEARSFPQLYPGLCGRQEHQHKALQLVGAPDTRYTLCEQRGHQSTFNPLQLNLSPETSSPSTPLAVNSHQQHGHGSPTTQAPRRRARPGLVPALLACLPEHCGDIHASAKAGWQEAGQESSGDGSRGAGGAGTSAPSGCPMCDSPVPQRAVRRAQRQGCEQQGHSRGCHLLQECSSSIKDPVTQGTAGLQSANSQKGSRAEL